MERCYESPYGTTGNKSLQIKGQHTRASTGTFEKAQFPELPSHACRRQSYIHVHRHDGNGNTRSPVYFRIYSSKTIHEEAISQNQSYPGSVLRDFESDNYPLFLHSQGNKVRSEAQKKYVYSRRRAENYPPFMRMPSIAEKSEFT